MTDKTQPTAHACIKPQCDPAKCSDCACAITSSDGAGQVVLGLLNAFAVNDLGHPFEDGDSAAVDRARQWLQNRSTALQAAPPAPASVAVPELAKRIKDCAAHWAYMERIDHGDQAAVEKQRHAELVDQLAAAPAQAWPSECDSPELCQVHRGCAGQYGTKNTCPSFAALNRCNSATPAQAVAVPAVFGDEDHVLVPRGLIGSACRAIDKKRDGAKTLAELRRYTVGDLSAPAPAQEHATQLAGQGLEASVTCALDEAKNNRCKCGAGTLMDCLSENCDVVRARAAAPIQAQEDARDADRYRWVKQQAEFFPLVMDGTGLLCAEIEEAEEAIDAEIAAARAAQGGA